MFQTKIKSVGIIGIAGQTGIAIQLVSSAQKSLSSSYLSVGVRWSHKTLTRGNFCLRPPVGGGVQSQGGCVRYARLSSGRIVVGAAAAGCATTSASTARAAASWDAGQLLGCKILLVGVI